MPMTIDATAITVRETKRAVLGFLQLFDKQSNDTNGNGAPELFRLPAALLHWQNLSSPEL